MELTQEQAYVVMDALELYSRIHMGQFENIEFMLSLDRFNKKTNMHTYNRDLAKEHLMEARDVLFEGLSRNAYVGIIATNRRSQISWDVYQKIRYDISDYKNMNGEHTATYGELFRLTDEPLPKITITEEPQ